MNRIYNILSYMILVTCFASCHTNIIDEGMEGFVEQTTTFGAPSSEEAVDLGLSVKWAPYNVGASKPTEYGNYYAWGEIEPKTDYSSETYVGPADFFGSVDAYGTEYDVAYVKWGHEWRIPTMDELIEIQEKCKWEATEQDGVKGMKVTGPNGNSIFFPAAGRCVGNRFEDVGVTGHYWQGCANGDGSQTGEYTYYDLNAITNGLTIRPVLGLYSMSLINEANLNGWDYGLTNKKQYLVYKINSDETTTVCVSNYSDSLYSFILDIDNTTMKITGFGTSDKYYPVKEYDDEYILYQWVDDNIEFFSIPKQDEIQQSLRANLQTRNPMLIGGIIVTSYIALKNLYKLSNDLHDGRWGDFFNDLEKAAGSEDEFHADSPFVDLANERANQLKAEMDYHNAYQMYGDATIRITAINKQTDESYVVHAEVDGISSIQQTIGVLTETSYVECENHVYAGIVCRKSYPAFINDNTHKSYETEISDGSNSTKYISFDLPKLDKGKYYLKPYLRSSINDIISSSGNSYIRYGEQKEIDIIGGQIVNFEQIDAQCIGGAKVTFIAYANVEIDSNDGLEDWGVYYIKDGIYKTFSASWPTAKVNEDIRIEITIPREDFDYVDYDNFTASKSINLGVFQKRKNLQGVYDYLTYDYGEMSEYQLEYDKEICFSISNVSVTGHEPYSDADGRDRKCNYEYAFEVDGCLFFNSIISSSGENWASDFQYTVAEGCKDGYKDTFSSSYCYFSEGTSVGNIYFAAILGNGVYYKLPHILYCDNGSVYLGGGTRSTLKTNGNSNYKCCPSICDK